MTETGPPDSGWQAIRGMPEFRRLLELRAASQFADGLFQAGLVGAVLFDPERAAGPWEVVIAFAVMFLPYSVLGPFSGPLLDRWDRRLVLIGANAGRLAVMLAVATALALGAHNLVLLSGALIVNGFTRFVSSGLSAALPHVVRRERVVTMNSVATATGSVATFAGANLMWLPRELLGADDTSASVVIFLAAAFVGGALLLSVRFAPHVLGPDDSARAVHGSVGYAVVTGWVHGARTVVAVPALAATLSGLAAHRMAFGINTMLMLVIVRHTGDAELGGMGIGTAALFLAAGGIGMFCATVLTPALVGRWGRYRTANGALLAAAVIQLAAIGLEIPVMVACGFLLGAAGQVVKLCADSAIQIDVDDALRGHVFTFQDAMFWVVFVAAAAAAAAVIPADGRSAGLVVAGSLLYLAGLGMHASIGRRTVTDV